MKTMLINAGAAVAFGLTLGCRTFTPPADSGNLEDQRAYWLHYDATRRGAFVIPEGKKVRTISEPAPDVGLETITKLAGKLDYKGVGGEASADITEKLVQLGERTQMIMFLRETMFRLSEVGNNADWSKDEYKQLYQLIIEAAVKLADAQVQSIGSDRTKAEAKKVVAETEKAKAVTEKVKRFEDIHKANPDLFNKLLQLDK